MVGTSKCSHYVHYLIICHFSQYSKLDPPLQRHQKRPDCCNKMSLTPNVRFSIDCSSFQMDMGLVTKLPCSLGKTHSLSIILYIRTRSHL